MNVAVAALVVLLVASAPPSAEPSADGVIAGPTQGADDAPGTPARHADAARTWLELLREAIPEARHVSILVMLRAPHDLEAAAWSTLALEATQAARRSGMRAEIMTVRHRGELLDAFVMMRQSSIDSVVVLPTPFALDRAADVAAEAARHRLPLVGGHRHFADAGALMSYGVEPLARGDTRATRAGDFELVINRKTARALGLTIHPPLWRRADRIID